MLFFAYKIKNIWLKFKHIQNDYISFDEKRKLEIGFQTWLITYCQEPGLNWWHVDFQSTALPTELSRHIYNITAYLLFDNTKITSILILVKMEVIFVFFSFALTLIYHLIELALFLHHLRQRQRITFLNFLRKEFFWKRIFQ